MRYWMMKSEPDVYGIDDLVEEGTDHWDGIRNFQARNIMRDQMSVGDLAFFYHSNAKPPGVAGVMEIVREAYPDHTQFDPTEKYYDPKSDPDDPRWIMVDVKFVEKFPRLVSLQEIKSHPELADMVLVRNPRLSVQPVTEDEWEFIVGLSAEPAPE